LKSIVYIIAILCLFGLTRCAQQIAPTGGLRDLYPPILDTLKSNPSLPENFSTGFNAKEITLTFNEFIELSDPNKNIVITPSLIKNPVYRVKGKKLYITLADSLLENTTYTINFGNAIKDITEGNIVKNFNYVFSTGTFIDSLQYAGRVYDAITKKPLENITVMLYNQDIDSIPLKDKPLYFTSTNGIGKFNFKYLKPGRYKIIAINDLNNDYRYNPKTESVAFMKNQIELPLVNNDTIEHKLILFKENTKTQFVTESSYSHPGLITIVLNMVSEGVEVKDLDGNIPKYLELSNQNDTINIWIDSIARNKSDISFALFDETNNFSDTIKIKIIAPKKPKEAPLTFTNNLTKGLNLGRDIELKFNTPLALIDSNEIKITRNDEPVNFKMEKAGVNSVIISSNWKPNSKYTVKLLPKAFVNIYGTTTDTIERSFRCKSDKDYGSLLFDLSVSEGNYLLFLYKEDALIKEVNFTGKSYNNKYSQLSPGNYSFKLVYDENNNGKWDTGDLLKKLQPERIEYYTKGINIRAGWDLDVTWKISD